MKPQLSAKHIEKPKANLMPAAAQTSSSKNQGLHVGADFAHVDIEPRMMPGCRASTSSLDGRPLRPGCFFFVVAPFCSCPASLVSRKFFAVGPGCAKCFFFCCAPLGAVTFRRGQSKKKTPPRVLFLLRPRGKAGEGEAPCRHGARAKKKNTTQGFFFAPAPGKGKGRRSPVGRRHGARAKKKTPPRVCFFLLQPRGKAGEGEAPLGAGTVVFFFLLWPRAGAQRGFSFPCLSPGPEQKKKHLGGVFFLLWPRAGAQRGFSFPCLSPGPQQKKKLPGWFFFCSGPVPARGFSFPCLSPGPEQKKNTLGGVFFFAAAPRGRSLTHCGPGWRCLPLGGVVFFFCCGPARTGVVFFFLLWPRPDAHSLTVGWGDFGKARVVFFFFAAAPPGLFRQ